MPNWIEGTLKIRGTYENVKRFFMEQIEAECHNIEVALGLKPAPPPRQIVSEDEDGWLEITEEAYIKGTRRAFVKPDDVYLNPEKTNVAVLNIRQAWSFTAYDQDLERWEAISKKYGVDIRLYGVERGVEFVETLEIINGETTAHDVIEYDDWKWECPFPNLGG